MTINELNLDSLFSENGYPSQHLLDFFETYLPLKEESMTPFLDILKKVWWCSDGLMEINEKEGKQILSLSTGGWSGNEEIIASLLKNAALRYTRLYYIQWNAGGHYKFEIK